MFDKRLSSGIALTLMALTSMGSASAEELRFVQVKDSRQLKEGMSYVLVGQWADPDNPGLTRYYVMGSYSQTDTPAGRPAIEVKLSDDGSLLLGSEIIADGPADSEKDNKALLLDLTSNHYYYFGYELTAHGTNRKLYGYGTSKNYTYGSSAENACLPLLSSGSIQTRGWDIEFTPRRWYQAWYDDYYYGLQGIDPNEYPEELDGTVNLISKYHPSGDNYAKSFSSIVFTRNEDGRAYFSGGSGIKADEKGIQHFVSNTLLFRQECDHPNLQTYSEEPDCWSSGVDEIWYCDKCDEYYADKTCTKPTTPYDHYLDPLGHKYGSDGFCVRCASSNREYKWVDYGSCYEDESIEMLFVAEKDGVAYAMTNQRSGTGYKAVPIEMDDQRRIFTAENNLVVMTRDDWWNLVFHGRQLCCNLETHRIQFRPEGDSYWSTASWNYSGQPYQYAICFLENYDYYLGLVADGEGGYNFEAVTAEEYEATPEKERFHFFYKSCPHTEMRHVAANEPTCEKFGNIEFWHCNQCNTTFTAYTADREILLDDEHTTTLPALRHHYEEGSTRCAHCGKEAPVYRRVEHQSELSEGAHYLVGAEVDGKVYVLGSCEYQYDDGEEDEYEEEEEDGNVIFNPLVDYDPEVPGSAPRYPTGRIPIVVETVPEADGSIRANHDDLERLRTKTMHIREDESYYDEATDEFYDLPRWWKLWNLVTDDFRAWAIGFESYDTRNQTYDDAEAYVFGRNHYNQEDDYSWDSPYGECQTLSIDVLDDRDPTDVFANSYRGYEYTPDEGYFYGYVPEDRKQPYNVFMNQVYAWWSDPTFDFAYHHGQLKSRYEEEETEETEGEEGETDFYSRLSPGKIILSDDYETGCYGTYPIVLYYCADDVLNSYDEQKQEVTIVGEDLGSEEVVEAVVDMIEQIGMQVSEDVPSVVSSINLTNATLAEGITGEQLYASINQAVSDANEEGYNLVASQNLLIVVPAESDIQGTNIINNGVCQNLSLTDLQPLALTDDIVAEQFAFSREFKHNWSTLVLPVSVALPEDLAAQEFESLDLENLTITFTAVDKITANVPVIIRAKGVVGSDIRGERVTVSTDRDATDMTFEGTYRDIYGNEAAAKHLFVLNANNQFVPAGSNTHIGAFRAYLRVQYDADADYDYAPLRVQIDEATGLFSLDGKAMLKVAVTAGGLSLLGEAGTDVTIRSIDGKVMAQFTLTGQEHSVELPAGAYLVNETRVIVK